MNSDVFKKFSGGLAHGAGFSIAAVSMLAASAFAASAWGSLPSTASGSALSSGAWNDLITQVNTITSAIGISSGNVGIGTTGAPAAKLDVNGDAVIRGGLTTNSTFGSVSWGSLMPLDMSFPADGSVLGSVTGAMPVGTYHYQLYGCAGQNNFSGGALGEIVFVSGSGDATPTNYFDNTNVGGGSCGYFRSGFIKVTTANSTVRLKIKNNYAGGSNVDLNLGANSLSLHIWKLF